MKALLIHDLSSVGKSSLTVCAPVLEAMGIEAIPLPSALFSSQSDGFDDLYYKSSEEWLSEIYNKIKGNSVFLDGVYSGFLPTVSIIEKVEKIMENEDGLKLVDPVLGDNGSLYPTLSGDMVNEMVKLTSLSDIITPNYTEACFLTLSPYKEKIHEKDLKEIILKFRKRTVDKGVITSVPLGVGKTFNIAWDNDRESRVMFDKKNISFPGAGDLFASVLFSLVLKGNDFFSSVEKATVLSSKAVDESLINKRERRMGIDLYLTLKALISSQPS